MQVFFLVFYDIKIDSADRSRDKKRHKGRNRHEGELNTYWRICGLTARRSRTLEE